MSGTALLLQFLNGLAGASSLFLVAAGLSLIFGVSRIVNFAHGSLYMLGMYVAVALSGPLGFWAALPLAAVAVGLCGIAMEILVLRRLYGAPELLQLLATFALVLMLRDFALWAWGPEDLLGPRAPGLGDAIGIAGRPFPQYDLFLLVLGPVVFAGLMLLLKRTRWGILVRAASQDREMAGALGIDERRLFTAVFALGALLAGIGGASAIPREPANLGMDLAVVADAFVVVVLGGLGSLPGAFAASFLIGEVKAFCIAFGFSKATLAIEFVVMALVLVVRPWGLLGRPELERAATARSSRLVAFPTRTMRAGLALALLAAALVPFAGGAYATVLMTDIVVFALFATSLQFLMGPGGMASFGHAAYFGIGAHAAVIVSLRLHWPIEAALPLAPLAAAAAAAVFGWFCVRLSGIYLAMLTLAFAQIAWSMTFQWDRLTGGSNGLLGAWPPAWLAGERAYYFFVLAVCAACLALLWRTIYTPFGYTLRAARDSASHAEAAGIDVRGQQWLAFVGAGAFAGIAGALYAFSKGSISPELLTVGRSVDGLVMVLLGGVHTLTGAAWGAALFTWLQDTAARDISYWRAALGAVILAVVIARAS